MTTTTSLVDNATAEHGAPCLQGPGRILEKYDALASNGSSLGASKGPERHVGDGRGRYVDYEHGLIYWTVSTGAHAVVGVARSVWLDAGGPRGALGYPRGERVYDDDGDFNFAGKVGTGFDQREAARLHELLVARTVDRSPFAAKLPPGVGPRKFVRPELVAEVRFSEWRFHHLKVVERAIGDRSAGTAGSSGGGYLLRTLSYRFFPELWEARNRLTARATRHPGQPSTP